LRAGRGIRPCRPLLVTQPDRCAGLRCARRSRRHPVQQNPAGSTELSGFHYVSACTPRARATVIRQRGGFPRRHLPSGTSAPWAVAGARRRTTPIINRRCPWPGRGSRRTLATPTPGETAPGGGFAIALQAGLVTC